MRSDLPLAIEDYALVGDGIWEVRGGRRLFTFSKVMAWVAFDRTVRDAERFKLEVPLERWRQVRDHIHTTICEHGFDKSRNTFTQSFGGSELDASLLLIPVVGFLPPDDPRVRGTVAAIERELVVDGFVLRYQTKSGVDGLPPGVRCLPPLQFLARRQLYAAESRCRSIRTIRAAAIASLRCRPARGRIRSLCPASDR